MSGEDYPALARHATRSGFSRAHGGHFLVGEPRFAQPEIPASTYIARDQIDPKTVVTTAPMRVVCAVRKTTEEYPSKITVGRTSNNDIPFLDVTVSRFHAYFRETEEGLQLIDAGSQNGTKVNGMLLTARQAVTLRPGDRVAFGNIELTLVDAAACWDFLQRR